MTCSFCRDCDEYKKWKASKSGESGVAEAVEALTLRDKNGNEIEKQLPGGKKKVKTKPQVAIERPSVRLDTLSGCTQHEGYFVRTIRIVSSYAEHLI